MKKTFVICLLVASMAACSKAGNSAGAPVAPSRPVSAAAARPDAPAAPQAQAQALTGTVIEAVNVPSYTYIHLQTATGEVWTAVPQTEVKKGQTVSINAQMTMNDFKSSALNRTFASIVFGTLAGAQPAGAGMGGMMGGAANPHGQMTDKGAAMADSMMPKNVKVDKAQAADAKTVEETWSGRTSLKDKTVTVRGTVVKFLPGIMGKNWIHLRDGSGSRDAKNDDITVTTADNAKVGDVVTVHGTVHIDKDLGAGYNYPVIIEEASVKK